MCVSLHLYALGMQGSIGQMPLVFMTGRACCTCCTDTVSYLTNISILFTRAWPPVHWVRVNMHVRTRVAYVYKDMTLPRWVQALLY